MNMKKLAYLGVFAGLLLTSCIAGDYGIKPADPQTNEQEEAVTFPTSLSATAVSPIDLAAVEGEAVAIAAYTPVETAVGEIDNFRIVIDDKYVFPVTEDMSVPVDSLQNMVIEVFNKRPTPRTFKGVLEADVMVGGQASYVTSASFDVILTPKAPFISSGYYLIGNMNGILTTQRTSSSSIVERMYMRILSSQSHSLPEQTATGRSSLSQTTMQTPHGTRELQVCWV